MSDNMECPNCNRTYDDFNFCPTCGKKLVSRDNIKRNSITKMKETKINKISINKNGAG